MCTLLPTRGWGDQDPAPLSRPELCEAPAQEVPARALLGLSPRAGHWYKVDAVSASLESTVTTSLLRFPCLPSCPHCPGTFGVPPTPGGTKEEMSRTPPAQGAPLQHHHLLSQAGWLPVTRVPGTSSPLPRTHQQLPWDGSHCTGEKPPSSAVQAGA